MKKKWLKKGSAVLLTAAMILSLFPGTKGTLATVQAAPNDAPTSGYWTDAAGLKEFGLSGTKTIGKIRFGASDRIWAICGADTDGSLALLSTSEFTPENPKPTYGSTSEYSQSKFVNDLDNYVSATENTSTYLSTTYFSTGELGKMADVTVSTNEPDGSGGNHLISVMNKKLYLPNSQDQNTTGTTIYVGSSNDIAIDVAKLKQANGFQENLFWLRSPIDYGSDLALVAFPGYFVDGRSVSHDNVSVVPALNLNLSSDIFASAAGAASSSYSGYKANSDMTENTYTLRYTYTDGTDSAVINPSGTQVKVVTGASGKYLMVQNNTGVYALAIDSADKIVDASDIQMGDAATGKLENFNDCKVWIESTDTTNRITTAKMAVRTVDLVAVTDITAPVVGDTLVTTATCNTSGIKETAPTVTWTPDGTASYNRTYTASVTLSLKDGYELASEVTATVDDNTASVVKNGNGTITVSYTYKTEFKALSDAYFATVDDLKECYNISGGTIGKIKFGLDGTISRLWAICGTDADGSLSLLSTSEFGRAAYGSTSEYSESNFVNNLIIIDSNGYLSTTYFSTGELGKMAEVTVSTNEPDGSGNFTKSVENRKLYLPNSKDQNTTGTTIYVGSSNNIAIDVAKLIQANGFQKNLFWLRSPGSHGSDGALVAFPGDFVYYYYVYYDYVSVVPALNLNLSSVLFASAAEAASSSYNEYKANSDMKAKTFTLRYAPESGSALATATATINPAGSSVAITGAANGMYLVAQNEKGVSVKAISSSTTSVGISEMNGIDSFSGCKVWLESTDTNRITTAKMATQDKASVTITNPEDSHITIATTVDNGTASQTDITGEMTAVTYTAAEEYYFPENYVSSITGLTNGSLDGVSVTRVDASTIKVSGAPTATTVNITLIAATQKTYTIETDVVSKDFGSKNAGYSTPTEQTITITNTGNQSVTLSKNTLTNYTVSDFSATTLAPNATATFTVQPKANLTAGTYNEAITVSTENGTDTSIPVTFKVNGAFSVTINPSSATITNGDSKTLTANPTGGSGTYTYKWYAGTETTAFATTKEVTVNPSVTTTYKVVVNDMIEDKKVTATITVNPRTYTITYNSNGGTGTMDDGTATEDVAFTLPACGFSAPTDKQFKNWAIGSVNGTAVNANGTYTFTGVTTVYAIWEDLPSVETPTANPVAGTYTVNQSVTLSTTTTGADIYYTTNGDTPSKTNGTKYTGAISVTGTEGKKVTTTIKAVAVKDGMLNSGVVTLEYIIDIHDTTAPAVPVPDTTTVTSQAATTVSTTQTVTITGTTVDVTTVPVATTTTAQKITPEVTTTTTTAAVITPEVTTTTTTAAVIPAKEVETPKEEIEAPDDTTPLGYYSNPGDEPAKITIDIPNKYQGNDFNYYLVNADGDKIYPDKNSDGKLTFTVGSKDEFLLVLDDPNPLGIVDPADNLPKTGTLPVMLYGVSGFAILLAGAYVLSSEQRKFRK